MDEIGLMREFRNGLPEPRAEVRDAACAALVDRFEPQHGPSRKRTKGEQMKIKIAMLAAAAVGVVAVLAVSAGAFDRTPVAPQLSPEEAGVKPGVVPGEVQEFHSADGQTSYGEVSPCIESDPSGYSDAELEDPEWCFHSPGDASLKADTQKESGQALGPAKTYHLSNGEWVKVYSGG